MSTSDMEAKEYFVSIIGIMCDRYLQKLSIYIGSDATEIRGVLETLKEQVPNWPEDKSSRWLGYVQGYLRAKILLNIQEERDFSRPYFHEYYRRIGIDPPKSVDVLNPKEVE